MWGEGERKLNYTIRKGISRKWDVGRGGEEAKLYYQEGN